MIVSIALFGSSFSVVEQNFIGMKYNEIKVEYDKDLLYKPGKYFVGLGQSFKQFPTTWQRIGFCSTGCADGGPVSSKTGGSNSVPVQLEVMIYYKVRAELAPELIDRYPRLNWHTDYVQKAKSAIQSALNKLSLDELITKRESVAQTLALAVNTELMTVNGMVVACYLGSLSLADSSNQAYIAQRVTQRNALTGTIAGEIRTLQEQTKADVAKEQVKVSTMLSESKKITDTTVAEARALGSETILKAQGEAYQALKTLLSANVPFTNDDLLKFIWYSQLGESDTNTSLATGFDIEEVTALA